MRRYRAQIAPTNESFHYTPAELAANLLALVKPTGFVVDPSPGNNPVFLGYPVPGDYLQFNEPFDWAITNPPYHLAWKFIEHSATLARKGFAFLINANVFMTLTPKRLQWLSEIGFHLNRIHIVNVKEWFGRYYFVVFTKKKRRRTTISWTTKTYSKASAPVAGNK